MTFIYLNKIKEITNHWGFWLFLITIIAIFIRSVPALFNAAWGNDFGIYYGLTNSFVQNSGFINSYDGWGSSYQYFPVLYAITGLTHWITGIEIMSLMPKIAPIFGGLTIPILYFIVYELMKNRRVAFLSSILLTASTFHIYQTSHAAPLTIGHFFMLLSFYFFIKYIHNREFIVPLLASTFLLILSHHFTTYFYIISITFVLFTYIFSNKLSKKSELNILLYIILTSVLSFSYWAFIAKPVFNNFIEGNMFLPANLILILYYIILIGGYYFLSKNHDIKLNIFRLLKVEYFSIKNKILVIFTVLLSLSLYALFMGIPGVYIKITPLALIYSLPMIFLVSISLAGFSYLKETDGGLFIRGWALAIILSFLYSLVSSNLLPDRHLEYMIVPLCIPAAIIINDLIERQKGYDIKKASINLAKPLFRHPQRNIFALLTVFVLFISNMIVAYPTIDALNSIDERVSQPCINSFEWMQGNISNESTIASDHRLSMILWAEGFNITYGETNNTWLAENYKNCSSELDELNISYIVIDDIMKEKIVNIDVGKYYQMSNESYEKFLSDPFELIYRNSTYNNLGEEIHWVEIYKVNKYTKNSIFQDIN